MSTIETSSRPAGDHRAPALTGERFAYDVAIVGLGYVGLPTALAYYTAGTRVLALDVSPARLAAIAGGRADLLPPDRARLADALGDPRFRLTADARELSSAAAVVVCVPTPVDERKMPDLTALSAACASVVAAVQPGQVLMLTSTTYVGCTHDLLVKPLLARGLAPGRDVFVTFAAERIDPGNASFAQEAVPRVVGGATPGCEEEGARLLSRYVERVHRVSSLGAAEMTKLLENTFRAVNIALINEFADICSALSIDVCEVIEAASTKPYGYMAFTPGPGVGGHCIPCDPHYLLWQLRALPVSARVITEAMSDIAARPRQVVERVCEMLGGAGIGRKGARVLVVGVTYKPDVADVRESPALEIIETLRDLGVDAQFVDDRALAVRLRSGEQLRSLTDAGAFDPHLVLVHTRHSGSDLSWIDEDRLVLDGTYRSTDLSGRALL